MSALSRHKTFQTHYRVEKKNRISQPTTGPRKRNFVAMCRYGTDYRQADTHVNDLPITKNNTLDGTVSLFDVCPCCCCCGDRAKGSNGCGGFCCFLFFPPSWCETQRHCTENDVSLIRDENVFLSFLPRAFFQILDATRFDCFSVRFL